MLFRSWGAAFASFLTGVFTDLDHLLEYFVKCGFNFDVRKFYVTCMRVKYRRLILFMHSFELLGALWILIYVLKLGDIWIGAAIGYTQHLMFDYLLNPITATSGWSYFFLYRMVRGFDRNKIIKNA